MANKKKKSKTEKALGQDPFEGLFESEWEEADNEIITVEPVSETNQAIEPSEATDEPEPELEPVTEVETEATQAAEPPAKTEEPEVETAPVTEAENGDHRTAEPSDTVEAGAEATQATELPVPAEELEVETAPVTEADNGDHQTAEPPDTVEVEANLNPEENSGMLDEIIATIDQEIEQTLGVDLLSDRSDEIPHDMSGIEEQHIIFTLAGTLYAVPAANVREVGELANLTPVPNVPDWLLGATNLRGDVLSVVDLHTFLNLGQPDYVEPLSRGEGLFNTERELLIVHPRGDASLMTTGLVVDEVNDIRYLTVDHITTPAAPIEDQIGPYLRGIYEYEEDLLVVLNFERLLLSPEMQQFELL